MLTNRGKQRARKEAPESFFGLTPQPWRQRKVGSEVVPADICRGLCEVPWMLGTSPG